MYIGSQNDSPPAFHMHVQLLVGWRCCMRIARSEGSQAVFRCAFTQPLLYKSDCAGRAPDIHQGYPLKEQDMQPTVQSRKNFPSCRGLSQSAS